MTVAAETVEPPERLLGRACADLDRRLRAGDDARAEHWLDAHPTLRSDADLALELVLHEYTTRTDLGSAPPAADWYARFPQWQDRLRRLFQLLDDSADPPAVPSTTHDDRPAVGQRRPPADSPAGYAVTDKVGSGGMGVVYRAVQRGTGRVVALKMLRAGPDADDTALARLRAEAEAVARFQHPNIVQIFEIGEHDGLPFLALEYVAGGTLQHKLAGRPLPTAEAAALVRTLAVAVGYAHGRGIVHRDLKPANVLLTSDGVAKVADFGLAKRLDGPNVSVSGPVVGTAAYMAPEQAGGSHAVGPPADVYALGAVLYECLTGTSPHRGDSVLEVLRQVVAADPVPPRRLRPRLPQDLETVCLKCLRKDPSGRYPSAQALADDLDRFLAGEPVRARPVGVVVRLAKWARRRPLPAALGGSALLAVVGIVGVVAWHDARQRAANATLQALNGDLIASNDRLATAVDHAGRARYAAHMGLARQALEAGQGRRLAEYLVAQVPADADNRDFRCFGWHLLRSQQRNGLLAELPSPEGVAWAVEYAPDGRTLAVAHHDGRVLLWDVTGRRVRHTLVIGENRTPGVRISLAFSPDGRTLATADGRLRFWDPVGGDERPSDGLPSSGHAVAYAPTVGTLAVGDPDRSVTLWNLTDRTKLHTLRGHTDIVHRLTFSPDGKTLASVAQSRDPSARLWAVDTGRSCGEFTPERGSGGLVHDVAFSPDGRTLAVAEGQSNSAQPPGRVHTLDASTLKPASASPAWFVPAPGARSVRFSPDGNTLAAAVGSGPIRLWEIASRTERVTLYANQGIVHALAYAPDGRSLTSCSNRGEVTVWDANASGTDGIASPDTPPPSYRHLTVSPDGRTFAVGGADGRVRVGSIAARRFTGVTVPGCEKGGTAVVYSPGGRLLASPCPAEGSAWPGDRATAPATVVELSDPETGRLHRRLTGHTDRVLGVAFSPDGAVIATGGVDATVRLWDVATGVWIVTLPDPPDKVFCLAYSPDGKTLVAGGQSGVVTRWDVVSRRRLDPALRVSTSSVMAVSFDPAGATLAAGDWGGTIALWDTATGRRATLIDSGGILTLAFTPDGQTLATAGTNGTIRFWDPVIGQERFSLPAHTGWVHAAAFAPDGQTLLSSSSDATIRVWRAPH